MQLFLLVARLCTSQAFARASQHICSLGLGVLLKGVEQRTTDTHCNKPVLNFQHTVALQPSDAYELADFK